MTSSLDSSNHSDHFTPPPPPLVAPGSPNGVEDFAYHSRSLNKSSGECSDSDSESDSHSDSESDSDCDSVSSDCDSMTTSPYFPDQSPSPIQSTSDSSNTKKVHFYSRVRVRYTISHHTMSPKEVQDCWYHRPEYDAIRQTNNEILKRMEARDESTHESSDSEDSKNSDNSSNSSNSDTEEDDCIRGLENALEHGHKRRKALRKTATTKVLDEQYHQHRWGICDDEAIAKVYARVARKSRFRAEVRALRDRSEVEDYLMMSKMDNSNSDDRNIESSNSESSNSNSDSDFEDFLLQGLENLKTKGKNKSVGAGLIRKLRKRVRRKKCILYILL